MYRLKLSPTRLGAAFLVALTLVTGSVLTQAALAQYVPPDRGIPGRRVGGGTRSASETCWNPSATALTALMPTNSYGETVSEYPSFFFFLPENNVEAAEFLLEGEDGTLIYQATFNVSGESGVISLQLPTNAGIPALEVGTNYHWSFALVCDRRDRSGDQFVDGWLQRVEPPASLTATPTPTSEMYAQAGLWYEAVALLAEQQMTGAPEASLLSRWEDLLDSVGLGDLADAPMLGTVVPAEPSPTPAPESSTR